MNFVLGRAIEEENVRRALQEVLDFTLEGFPTGSISLTSEPARTVLSWRGVSTGQPRDLVLSAGVLEEIVDAFCAVDWE
jgi:hypothetical protein